MRVNPVLGMNTGTTVFTSALPFVWNGKNVTAAGVVSATLQSKAGCDSVVNLNVIVNPALVTNKDTTVCTSALPFVWNGKNVTAAGVVEETLQLKAGGDSVVNLIVI